MRTLLVLLLVLFGSDGGVPDAVGRPAAYAEARQSFVRAFQSGALDEARTALERRRAAAPGRVDVGYDLACVEARSGQVDRAFAALGPVAGAGLDVDPATDTDLSSLRRDARWAPLLARFAASHAPVSPKGSTLDVPPGLGLVEDVVEDPRTGDIFVSSVRTGEVWRQASGSWRRWAHPAPAGSGAFALGIDAGRRLLHVSVGVVPQSEGSR
jgi:hypothetical protein